MNRQTLFRTSGGIHGHPRHLHLFQCFGALGTLVHVCRCFLPSTEPRHGRSDHFRVMATITPRSTNEIDTQNHKKNIPKVQKQFHSFSICSYVRAAYEPPRNTSKARWTSVWTNCLSGLWFEITSTHVLCLRTWRVLLGGRETGRAGFSHVDSNTKVLALSCSRSLKERLNPNVIRGLLCLCTFVQGSSELIHLDLRQYFQCSHSGSKANDSNKPYFRSLFWALNTLIGVPSSFLDSK